MVRSQLSPAASPWRTRPLIEVVRMSVYLPRNTRRAGFVRPFQTSLPGGTEGSNPPPSSGKSSANLTKSAGIDCGGHQIDHMHRRQRRSARRMRHEQGRGCRCDRSCGPGPFGLGHFCVPFIGSPNYKQMHSRSRWQDDRQAASDVGAPAVGSRRGVIARVRPNGWVAPPGLAPRVAAG